jgi:hypothetical protein
MLQGIQLALGEFMNSLSGNDRTEPWEAHEPNQQFGDNESIQIGKSQ